MLHVITSGKDNIVFKRLTMYFVDLNEKRTRRKKGGSQILGWLYARAGGGGVIQMRTVCNGGVGGSKSWEKMRM